VIASEIYSKPATVHVVRAPKDGDKLATFHEAAADSGFVNHLEAAWQASGGTDRSAFRIAIKPNLMTASFHDDNSPVYTDPEMVEALVQLVLAAGFVNIAVVESHNVYDYSYVGRNVPAVAKMCGYNGQGYRIIDLSDPSEAVEIDYGGALGRSQAGRTWLEADYRVSFAKNKTHWQCYYTACLKNVYGCLPLWDKMQHYHGKNIEFFQAALLCAEKMPVHFGFLDAWTSGDGISGHVRDANPNHTHTVFASDNVLALDYVAGEKMDLDPTSNVVVREAIARFGMPTIRRAGDLTPYANWSNVPRAVVFALDQAEEMYRLSRFFSRSLAGEMDPRFPPVRKNQWFYGKTQAVLRMAQHVVDKAT